MKKLGLILILKKCDQKVRRDHKKCDWGIDKNHPEIEEKCRRKAQSEVKIRKKHHQDRKRIMIIKKGIMIIKKPN